MNTVVPEPLHVDRETDRLGKANSVVLQLLASNTPKIDILNTYKGK